ncbi:amino acid deaminase [Pseudoalteromonas piratica]|uniref:Amino acid deaminase n=1 Tax=Pseudoalteromonas piratica TaxID=1348114 RepID=A0A0A7EL15_9GAMM|nr:amino acid deaminase [Pseudoalteromonas piratica]AIY67385.1 amino acid deaminase [Pseudoalteromonas piratica]
MNEVLKGSGNPQSLTKTGWHILREEVSFPVAVLSQSAISNNAKWMSEFCQEANVNLAPHGKTTMAPELFKMQLEHGAWGITLATVAQVLNAANHGVTRIILANQLVGKYHFKQIAQLLETTDVEFYCFVDSVENAKQIGAFFDARNTPINILLEIGAQGGRCGWRDVNNADAFLAVCEQHPSLKFSGIGFYEGVIGGSDAFEKVTTFVEDIYQLAHLLNQRNVFSQSKPIITGAGSAWYDVVASTLAKHNQQKDFNLVVRPGCYLIHDTGIYQDAQNAVVARSQLACDVTGELASSLTVWAYVVSRPEAGLAIVGLGKRDVAFDAGLPKAELIFHVDSQTLQPADALIETVKIMDQHAMLSIPENCSLQVGDMVCFSTSHPCLTFDKWRQVAIADDDWVIHKTISTFF